MSTLATYTFLPWLREGIANEISGGVGGRATIPVDVNVSGTKVDGSGDETATISKDIEIYGPGDIVGIDPKAIIKAEPGNWITNFEPNYLPYIEFYNESFPWQYTPLTNPDNHRLKPWLALIVLKETEFTDGGNIKDKPLPFIKLNNEAQLNDLEQSWAWAHVHVNESLIDDSEVDGETEVNIVSNDAGDIAAKLANTIDRNPDLAYSRIVCPRKLEPNVAYHAFLVPTFESGRLAGLGRNPAEVAFDTMAWSGADQNGLELPFYHRWYFRTGTRGDFEYLVRLLEPKPVDSRVGVRDMDVQTPGANLLGLRDEAGTPDEEKLNGILRLGGALRIPTSSQKDFAEAQRYEYWAFKNQVADLEDLETSNQPLNISELQALQQNIAAFINLSDGYANEEAAVVNSGAGIDQEQVADDPNTDYDIGSNPDPLITAPLYGQWHALTQRLVEERDESAIDPNYNWIHELNLDPRWRVSAGFGTKIVQENQENYMQAAWEQVGDVLAANKRIRAAQIAKATAERLYEYSLKPLRAKSNQKWLTFTGPVHARIVAEGLSVQYQKAISPLTTATTSVNFRKFIRPKGKLAKKLDFQSPVEGRDLLDRINDEEVSAAPAPVPPAGTQTPGDLVETASPDGETNFLVELVLNNPWIRWVPLALAIILAIILLLISIGTPLGIGLWLVVVGLVYLFFLFSQWLKQSKSAAGILEDAQTPESVNALPTSPDFKITTPAQGFVPTMGGSSDSEEGERFKVALGDSAELLQASALLGAPVLRPALDLDSINGVVLDQLSPSVTVPRWVGAGIQWPGFIVNNFKEEFEEAMAYPRFELPMYKPLVKESSELFLPNINYIAQNSISLLETNQKFIESYLVGLNHEFARELLWREYPTDQRGSYFRQFWETASYLDSTIIDRASLLARYAIIFETKDMYLAHLVEYRDQLADTDQEVTEEFLQLAHREIIKEELKDIKPLHYWSKRSRLGEHDNRELPGDTEEEAVLVIRGELLKKYPTAVIYAHRAAWNYQKDDDENLILDNDGNPMIDLKQERTLAPIPAVQENNPPTDIIKTPLYEAKVDPDIYFFGFDLTICEARGGSGKESQPSEAPCDDISWDDPGWFFIIKEREGEPTFGLDIGEGGNVVDGQIELWNDLSWGDVTPGVSDGQYLQITGATPTITADQELETDDQEKEVQQVEDRQLTWNSSMNAAHLAYILYQVPVLVAVHAGEMLSE